MKDDLETTLAGLACAPLKIEIHTNRHPNRNGTRWGWFTQNGKTIGHWSHNIISPNAGVSGIRLAAMVDAYKRERHDAHPIFVGLGRAR